jgi:hypothetical protein
MPETKQELEDENARLTARVQELEKELDAETKKRKRSSKASGSGSARSISNRAADEGSGLIRGVALAVVESVRSCGSVLSSFADTVSQRNRPEEKDSTADLTRDLPKDIYQGFVNAVEQSLEIPGRVVDRLQEGYREAKET